MKLVGTPETPTFLLNLVKTSRSKNIWEKGKGERQIIQTESSHNIYYSKKLVKKYKSAVLVLTTKPFSVDCPVFHCPLILRTGFTILRGILNIS